MKNDAGEDKTATLGHIFPLQIDEVISPELLKQYSRWLHKWACFDICMGLNSDESSPIAEVKELRRQNKKKRGCTLTVCRRLQGHGHRFSLT